MPYINRANIKGIFANQSEAAQDLCALTDADVVAYLAAAGAPTQDQVDLAAIKADAQVVAFLAMTPAQAVAWIDANVIGVPPGALLALKILAKASLVVNRRSLQ